MGPTPDPAARSPPGEACNDKTSGGSLEGSEHLPSTSPHPEGSARACGIGVWAAPQGKSGEGGGPREGGREGLASSGGQWGLPVGTQGPRTHRRKCGSARPLPAPPPTPRHPPPCSSRKGCADGERLAPGSECTQSPNRPGGEDATPDTDGRQGARGSPPRPGGSWVRELGSSQVRTVEQSPNNQWSLAPRLRRSPPPSPQFSKMKWAQVRRGFPPRKSQHRPAPLPSRAGTQRGAVSRAEGALAGDVGGSPCFPRRHHEWGRPDGPPAQPGASGGQATGPRGPDPWGCLATLRCRLYPQGPRSSTLSRQASPGKR